MASWHFYLDEFGTINFMEKKGFEFFWEDVFFSGKGETISMQISKKKREGRGNRFFVSIFLSLFFLSLLQYLF